MDQSNSPGFGSHVGAPYANYNTANKPWARRGRGQYIGRPICERVINENTVFEGSSESQSEDDLTSFTPESYFAASVDSNVPGIIDLSVADLTPMGGPFSATVTLQRSFDDGITWHDVNTYTEATQEVIQNPSWGVKWRLGVKNSDNYVSGVIGLRLSQV